MILINLPFVETEVLPSTGALVVVIIISSHGFCRMKMLKPTSLMASSLTKWNVLNDVVAISTTLIPVNG